MLPSTLYLAPASIYITNVWSPRCQPFFIHSMTIFLWGKPRPICACGGFARPPSGPAGV